MTMMKRSKPVENFKPKSFIPLPPIEENESVQVIADHPNPLFNRRKEYHTVHESFLHDVSESLEYTLASFKEEMKETKCLRKAILIYITLLQLNCLRSNYSKIFQFLMYYPTIVGWIYIFSKVRTMFDLMQSRKMQKTSSNQTLCTIPSDDDLSSHSDTDSVEVQEKHKMIQNRNIINSDMVVTVTAQDTWKESKGMINQRLRLEKEYNNNEHNVIPRIHNDEDYGHFVTFLDEEPRKPASHLSCTDDHSKSFYQRVREAITPYI
jgi:hypothetical protein